MVGLGQVSIVGRIVARALASVSAVRRAVWRVCVSMWRAAARKARYAG